jgi:N-methylhydantoinase A
MVNRAFAVGIDVGGTHTDVIATGAGRVVRGKAFTTYEDFSVGILDAIAVVAAELGLTVEELLGDTRLLINGTTVVTNVITQLSGARVGALVTAGFRDTFRLSGGPRQNVTDDHLQVNVPDLLSRRAIAQITERIDYAGDELVALSVEQVQAEADRLVEREGVEAIAIGFLNSHVNPEHEIQAAAIIAERHPQLFVTASHAVFPVRGETRRWTTAVLNCFVHHEAGIYIDTVSNRLEAAGLKQPPVFFQGIGGGISRERAKLFPLALLHSGPAAGALGANELSKALGLDRVLLGDMGGTSFDTGIIVEGAVQTEKNLEIGPFQTGVNIADVVSIGAGGGSVAWVSDRGTPQVGPRSMGSTPGPAAYGRGGEEPTVTDAMIVLGFIDPDNYLGGRFRVDRERAETAIRERFGDHFGWSAQKASAAIHDLVTTNMAHAVREISVEKGHDPRSFTFMAYGGTLPLFAAQIAERLRIPTVVVPQSSSVFCALGLQAADFILRHDQSVDWKLDAVAQLGRVNEVAERLVQQARDGMRTEGFADEKIALQRSADLRFDGQVYELALAMPDRALQESDIKPLAEQFHALYERTYGEGTAWQGAQVTLLNYGVTAIGRSEHSMPDPSPLEPSSPDAAQKGTREVYLPMTDAPASIAVYDGAAFRPGMSAAGPAIVDENDTTIFVPPDYDIARDAYDNYTLTRIEVPS